MEYSDKQVQIMEAAEKLFASKGFNGTSVRDIAETAGVNLAMISYYFGSKEKLFEAMFAWRTELFKLQLETMLGNKELSPLEKMDQLLDQYIQRLTKQQCFHRILVREQMMNNNEFITDQIKSMKLRNHALLHQLMKEGQEKEAFRNDVDFPLLMATMFGTVSHMVTTQHYYRETNGLVDMPDEEFQELMRTKLSLHLKKIFKAILTHEA